MTKPRQLKPIPLPAILSKARRHKHMIENHPMGVTVAANMAIEDARRRMVLEHHPMKLGIAIQFWKGDKAEALRLARFLADLEPHHRGDVLLILASRFDIPETDQDVRDAAFYCGRKFPTTHLRSGRIAEGHPAGCFGLWAGTAERCYELYSEKGWPLENVLFVEADGVPTRFDWIDWFKSLHQKNLDSGSRITGYRMEGSRDYPPHINGSLCMHMSAWPDYPSLHRCPGNQAWDCFHGQVLLGEAGRSPGICNLYGAHDLSMSVFKTLARDYAWVSSVKDESAWECAQTLLPKNWKKLARTVQPPKATPGLRNALARKR